MTILDVQQGSVEWLEARAGKATASRFKDILQKTANGSFKAGRKNYSTELLLERITHVLTEPFETDDMRWGRKVEPLARVQYALVSGNKVERVGFCQHDKLAAGASPDGLIGQDGGVEFKCRKSANHLETLHLGEMPPEYTAQVQGNLWITGRKWWDFVSFDPRFPKNAQLFIQRIERDEETIKLIETEVGKFLKELEDDIKFVEAFNAQGK